MSIQDDFADRVLALVRDPDYSPLTLKAVAKRFKVADDLEYVQLRASIKRLINEGALDLGKDKTIRKTGVAGTLTGTFRRASKGHGFVRLKETGQEKGKFDQIFIPPEASRDASTGDEVAVKIVKKPRGPGYKPEGRIVQVLTRAAGLFVGTYFEKGKAGMVKPDGTTFSEPIYVGDPGVKGAKTGDKVTFEMVRYPSPIRQGEGVVTEVLGARGQPGVDTLSVIRALGIPDEFEEEVLASARELGKQFNDADVEGREDLRSTLTVTIDPATARDFDDAISLSRDERGFWSLIVHIADVSHFVTPGSPIDRSARNRGTSVYLPDRVIPMLPEILSNSLASLQAGQTRYTVSAFIEFDAEGRVTDRRFARTAINVDQRFAYEQVMWCIEHPDEPMEGVSDEIRKLIRDMLELAMLLRQRRFKRGALELEMPEIEVEIGDQGKVKEAHLASHDESHQVIEEFMLAANEAVAGYLIQREVPFLHRAHPNPEPRKLEQFAEFARELGYAIEDPESRFELQRVLDESKDQPEAHAIHFGLLRSLKQAVYTPEPIGHYALASREYCHFTSPIRRYPDLQVHRQLTALIAGKTPKGDLDELMVLGEHCTKTERRAETAEREVIKIKLLTHLQTRMDEIFPAIIISVEDFGFFVRLIEIPVEGLVHLSVMEHDHYYLEPETHTLIARRSGARYRLGDRMRVRVVRVDVDRRELDLIPAPSAPEDEAELPPSRTRPKLPPKLSGLRPKLKGEMKKGSKSDKKKKKKR